MSNYKQFKNQGLIHLKGMASSSLHDTSVEPLDDFQKSTYGQPESNFFNAFDTFASTNEKMYELPCCLEFSIPLREPCMGNKKGQILAQDTRFINVKNILYKPSVPDFTTPTEQFRTNANNPCQCDKNWEEQFTTKSNQCTQSCALYQLGKNS